MIITLCNIQDNKCPFLNINICQLNSEIKVDNISGFDSTYDIIKNKIYGFYSPNCKLIKIKTLDGTYTPERIKIRQKID